jgi:dephospho-CoA kinase
MGKSTAARMLKRMGVPVFDSDADVHKALSPKGAAFEEVAVTFPEAWEKKTRTINRKILGAIVFNDAQKRKELESILHPIVQAGQKKFILSMQRLGKKIVALDIPLLFEIGAQSRVDYTICVSAPYEIQKRRVLARPNMDEERFLKIVAQQMPDAQKRSLADFVVQTGQGYALTYRQLQKIVKEVL